MKRREFIAVLGGAAATWPMAARGQPSKMPVIGYIDAEWPHTRPWLQAAFHQGLKEFGFVEGQNVAVEYRWANDEFERLPALATELVQRPVDILVATGGTQAVVAKNATDKIPVVFYAGGDPIELGVVTSFNRPGGNVTGISSLSNSLLAKRFELLHQLVPNADLTGALLHARNVSAESNEELVRSAAAALGKQVVIFKVASKAEIATALEAMVRQQIRAFLVGSGSFLGTHREQIVTLSNRYRLAASFNRREDVEAGGLMSYGASLTEALRLVGVYTGRILKGEKPAELPIVQPTKFELVLNAKTAHETGLSIPPTVLALADEVIE